MKTLRKKVICRIIILFLLVSTMNLFQGCMAYKQVTKNPGNMKLLTDYIGQEKYFILYTPKGTYNLKSPYLRGDTLFGQLMPVSDDHKGYIIQKGEKSPVLYQPQTKLIESEVLIFTNQNIPAFNTKVAVPVSSIQALNVYKWRMTPGSVFAVIMLTLGIVLGIMILTGLSNMSLGVTL
jgi:hypothetical protein